MFFRILRACFALFSLVYNHEIKYLWGYMETLEKEAAVALDYLSRISKEAEKKFDEFLPPVADRPERL